MTATTQAHNLSPRATATPTAPFGSQIGRIAFDGICAARQRVAGACRATTQLLGGRLISVPISSVSCEYGFSLADDGWHYFRALLNDHSHNGSMQLCDSAFYRFFRHPEIRAARYVNDVLFLHDPEKRRRSNECLFHFNTYPWGEWSRRESLGGGTPFGRHYDRTTGSDTRDRYGYRANIWYEPGDEHALQKEWRQTIDVYESVRQSYSPLRHGAFPEVVLLVRNDGAIRVIRKEGHHRLTALAQLGRTRVRVMVSRRSMGIVRERDVQNWYYVKHGLCSPGVALMIFRAFFELNGRERLKHLGIDGGY